MEKSRETVLKDLTIALTYRCNARCKMCNIWKTENSADLPLDYFKNLNSDLKYVNLSGGEPFLRNDITEAVKKIKQVAPKAQIIISTNGLLTQIISKRVEEILKIDEGIGIRVSLDGIGKKHDEIRGIPNFYSCAVKTLLALKKMGVKNLGCAFTIMDSNVKDIKPIYNFARKNNLQLSLSLVQNSEIFFSTDANQATKTDEIEKGLRYVIKNELKSWNPKKWLRAYYAFGLLNYAKNKKRLVKSGAGKSSAFIDPEGNIFPGNLINIKIGNLSSGKIEEIWNSEKADKVREEIKNFEEPWTICTLREEMKKRKFTIAFWILKNKIKNLL